MVELEPPASASPETARCAHGLHARTTRAVQVPAIGRVRRRAPPPGQRQGVPAGAPGPVHSVRMSALPRGPVAMRSRYRYRCSRRPRLPAQTLPGSRPLAAPPRHLKVAGLGSERLEALTPPCPEVRASTRAHRGPPDRRVNGLARSCWARCRWRRAGREASPRTPTARPGSGAFHPPSTPDGPACGTGSRRATSSPTATSPR